MDFLKKYDKNPFEDIYWNIPERKQGIIAVMGGNSQSFLAPVRTAEFLASKYPFELVKIILPDSLKDKIPAGDNVVFLSSTEAGSFADGEAMEKSLENADFGILIGDLSRNSITEKAVKAAVENSEKPLIITRDSVDAVATNGVEKTLMNEQIVFVASMAQLQKLFRAAYYPKMLLLTQSLIQVAEAFHKFTLSYPVKIVTLHNDQIIVAENGNIATVPLGNTGFSPITFWSGELAGRIAAMNLFTPHNFIEATIAAIYSD